MPVKSIAMTLKLEEPEHLDVTLLDLRHGLFAVKSPCGY